VVWGIGLIHALDSKFDTFPVIVAGNENRNLFVLLEGSLFGPINEKEDKHQDKAEKITI
jgi:hypothetical protein